MSQELKKTNEVTYNLSQFKGNGLEKTNQLIDLLQRKNKNLEEVASRYYAIAQLF